MNNAHYCVIRYNPDATRNEKWNIGILVWDQCDFRLRLDESAVKRILRENPELPKDSFSSTESTLIHRLRPSGDFSEGELRSRLKRFPGYPIDVSEPLVTNLKNMVPDPLEDALNGLLTEIVTVPKRKGTNTGQSLLVGLKRRLRNLIEADKVHENYEFERSQSGVKRRVELFANSTTNVAIDTLKLDLKDRTNLERADAEANKIDDIRSANNIGFIVCCSFSPDPALKALNEDMTRILAKTGAVITTDVEETAKKIIGSVA